MARKTEPETVAAVDLGSNSFHLLVAQAVGESLRVVDRLRERVALAEGLDARKRLDAGARQRALACLERFGQRLRDVPPDRVRAVGTNTLRQVRRPATFIAEAEAALGHSIEVISGQEEARLIYLGAAHSLESIGKVRRLVVDVGGGSTECIVGQGFETLRADSLFMGCVSWTKRFFPGGVITREAMENARLAARQELQTIERPFAALKWEESVGCSGSVHAVADVLQASGEAERGITAKGLRSIRKACVTAGHVDLIDLPGLQPGRRPVFAGGVAILESVFHAFGITSMRVSPGALREGVVHDLVGRMRRHDVRDRTVSRMAREFSVDRAQAKRVRGTALYLIDQVAKVWGLDDEEWRRFICWGAYLHEIGLFLAYSGYHHHGGYVARNAHLPGFARPGQHILAALIEGHRRRLEPEQLLAEVPGSLTKATLRVIVLLRVAALLHRTRTDGVPRPQVTAHGKRALELVFPDGWLDDHALTRADLADEARRLRQIDFRLDAR